MYTNTQNAARHTGAMQVLVDMLKNSDTHTEMLEIAAAAIRNLCGNSLENSEVCWCICVTSYRVGYICVYIYIYLYIYIYIYLSMGAVCVRVISTVCCMCVGIDAWCVLFVGCFPHVSMSGTWDWVISWQYAAATRDCNILHVSLDICMFICMSPVTYEWVNESRHIWMNHVSHEWVMSHKYYCDVFCVFLMYSCVFLLAPWQIPSTPFAHSL